ncbi:hypothetical protein [Ensifer aridi]|uniref:hypothetical protein n=1 Tax=Ensifer aridi TaxID=1708715 RepID=UPI0015E378AA|nr:hypothetical protein [Ensifer aridi]
MSLYALSKNAQTGKWHISHVTPGWITPIGGPYGKRKEALTVARLLAGRRGKVVIR